MSIHVGSGGVKSRISGWQQTFPTKVDRLQEFNSLGIPKQIFFFFKMSSFFTKIKQSPPTGFSGKNGVLLRLFDCDEISDFTPKLIPKCSESLEINKTIWWRNNVIFVCFISCFPVNQKFITDKNLKNIVDVPLWRTSHPYMGVSLNGGTPISHPKMIIFSRKKPMVVGETHHFRKPLYIES